MSYVDAGEKLIARHCGRDGACFWVLAALVVPSDSAAFFFDCTMYEHVYEEYRESPEVRVLLSFKSPLPPTRLAYTGRLGYAELSGRSSCDHGDVEGCIKRALEFVEEKAEEVKKRLSSPARESMSKIVPLVRRDAAALRGAYYGLLARSSILRELAGMMGFDGEHLRALVKPVRVLVSLKYGKSDYYALVCGREVELLAHKRVVDRNSVLKALGAQV